jgi:uncharacterized membrane protein YgcG
MLGLGPAALPAPPALAAPSDGPFGPATQVTDRAGALNAAQLSSVQQALNSLYAKDKMKLFVAYVKDFSGKSPTTWVDESAVLGGMGRRDVLLGIAASARQYAVSADSGLGLSTKQLDDVAATAIGPALRESDWAAAAIGAANGYAAAAAGRPIPVPTISPGAAPAAGGGGAAGSGSGSKVGVVIGVLVAVVLLGLLLFFFLRRRKGRDRAAAPEEPGGLTAAFKLRQQLDDDIPEDDAARRSMLEQLEARLAALKAGGAPAVPAAAPAPPSSSNIPASS